MYIYDIRGDDMIIDLCFLTLKWFLVLSVIYTLYQLVYMSIDLVFKKLFNEAVESVNRGEINIAHMKFVIFLIGLVIIYFTAIDIMYNNIEESITSIKSAVGL